MKTQVTRYDYTGGVQTITLAPGRYKLEAFGAGGGNDGGYRGGYGGYARGELVITANKTLFLCIGGAGQQGTAINGGYNGGGKSGGLGVSGSGGGATHIASGALDRGTLVNYETAKDEILLVAGGGGGAGNSGSPTGKGGGINGGPNNAGQVATQTTGYSFGQGSDRVSPGVLSGATTKTISGSCSFISRHQGANYFTTVATITITANGTLSFWSTRPNDDPYGYIYKNGNLYTSDDDSGPGLDFSMKIPVSIGEVITLKIAGFNRSGTTNWTCTYPDAPPVDGGGGGGGWYGGYCATSDSQGGGGSGYVNTSVLTNTALTTGGGVANSQNGYIVITKIIYEVKLTLKNCTGTTSCLSSSELKETIITHKGQRAIINSMVSYFVRWLFPEENDDIICTVISDGQCKVALKRNTTLLTKDITYVIEALYRLGRLNSNLYKRIQEQYLCELGDLL